MTYKISKQECLFFLYTVVALMPYSFKPTLFSAIEYLMIVISLITIIKNKYKPSVLVIAAICYHLFIVCITFIRGNMGLSFGYVLNYIRIIIYLMMLDMSVQKRAYKILSMLYRILLIYILIDFFSLIYFPDGIFSNSIVWNEWTTTNLPVWFLGEKNGRWSMYVIVLFLATQRVFLKSTKNNKIRLFLLFFVALISSILEESSTSSVVISVVIIGAYICAISRRKIDFELNMYWVLVGYFIIMILIIGGMSGFLQYFVESVLHKTMTFSNRTIAWQRTLIRIFEKPFFGSGYIDYITARNQLGSLTFNHAHNQWLQILWNGGLALCTIFMMLIFRIIKTIKRIKSKREELFVSFVFIAIFINMIFEVSLGTLSVWILLYMITNYHKNSMFINSLRVKSFQ